MNLPPEGYQRKILKTLCWSVMRTIPSSLMFFGVKVKAGSVSLYDLSPKKYGAQPITNICKLRRAYPHLEISALEVRWEKKRCNAYRIELPIEQVKAIYDEVS